MSFTQLKFVDLTDFRNSGLLQEVNRRAFHPLGLALVVNIDSDTGEVQGIAGIADYREDPEGIAFQDLNTVEANKFYEHALSVAALKSEARYALFCANGHAQLHDGFVVQSIGTTLPPETA